MPYGRDDKGRLTDGFGGEFDLMEGKNPDSEPTSKELQKLRRRNASLLQPKEDENTDPSCSDDEVK